MPARSKLEETPEIGELMLKRWRTSHNKRATAHLVNITVNTLDSYLKLGEEGEEPFCTFLAKWRKEEADWIGEREQVIRDAAKAGVWTAAAWDLERHLPEDYSLRTRVDHGGQADNPVKVEATGRLELTGDAALAVVQFHEQDKDNGDAEG